MSSSYAWSKRPLEEVGSLARQSSPAQLYGYIAELVEEHEGWHQRALNLVAAHNLLSPKALALLSSGLADKIQSGGIGRRAHGGAAWIDRLETLTVELAKRLFGVRYVEYRVPSGAMANGIALHAVTQPGDTVLAISRRNGADGTVREESFGGRLGLRYHDLPYDDEWGTVDLELASQRIREVRPQWIIVGSSSIRFPEPVRELAEIAREVGARIFYDGAHVLGLTAGGQFQHPLAEGAALMTGSTQKTLPGPVGGLILSNDPDIGERVEETTDRLVSNYHNNRVAALAVTLAETLAFGKEYTRAMVENAQSLARALEDEGFSIPGKARGYTMTHIVLVDLTSQMEAAEAFRLLDDAGVACSTVAFPWSYPKKVGLRLGTPAVTRQGMGAGEMKAVARLIGRVLLDRQSPAKVAKEVETLVAAFPTVRYCL